jgi:hypothetical protein
MDASTAQKLDSAKKLLVEAGKNYLAAYEIMTPEMWRMDGCRAKLDAAYRDFQTAERTLYTQMNEAAQ